MYLLSKSAKSPAVNLSSRTCEREALKQFSVNNVNSAYIIWSEVSRSLDDVVQVADSAS